MRIISTGDTHLGLVEGRTPLARERFKEHVYNQFMTVAKKAVKAKADVFIHAGDIFNRSKPPSWAISQYFEIVEYLLDNGVHVLVVPGNHDRAKMDGSLLEFYDSTYKVFNDFQYLDINGTRFIGFPYEYTSPRQAFDKAVEKSSSGLTFIICHQLFYGAKFGPHKFQFKYQKDVIQQRKFPSNIQILSGHIHRAQVLNDGHITYTGSPVRTSFAEVIEPKGYLQLDIQNDSIGVEFKEIASFPMSIHEIDHDIPISHLPRKIRPTADRTLIRLINRDMNSDEIKQMYAQFNKDEYPYLRITPNRPSHKLKPLYSNVDWKFKFSKIERKWNLRSKSS